MYLYRKQWHWSYSKQNCIAGQRGWDDDRYLYREYKTVLSILVSGLAGILFEIQSPEATLRPQRKPWPRQVCLQKLGWVTASLRNHLSYTEEGNESRPITMQTLSIRDISLNCNSGGILKMSVPCSRPSASSLQLTGQQDLLLVVRVADLPNFPMA